jgi:hypothetical protein
LVSYASFAVLDTLFLPTVAVIFIRLLLRAGNRRNLPLAGLLALLSLANGVFHASVMGWIDLAPVSALHGGLGLVVMIECVMAGRVVSAFTANATPGLKQVPQPRLGPATLAASGLALAGWVFAPTQGVWGPLVAAAALAAATLHLAHGIEPRGDAEGVLDRLVTGQGVEVGAHLAWLQAMELGHPLDHRFRLGRVAVDLGAVAGGQDGGLARHLTAGDVGQRAHQDVGGKGHALPYRDGSGMVVYAAGEELHPVDLTAN